MIRIRPLCAADVDAVLAVNSESPEAAAWNRQAYEDVRGNPDQAGCWVAEQEGFVCGFVCFRVVEREAELLNLAVLPSFRRQGAGSRLVARVLQEAAGRGAARIFLEVRDSNLSARRLYARHGFEPSARRLGYYSNPPADALVLSRSIEPSRGSRGQFHFGGRRGADVAEHVGEGPLPDGPPSDTLA